MNDPRHLAAPPAPMTSAELAAVLAEWRAACDGRGEVSLASVRRLIEEVTRLRGLDSEYAWLARKVAHGCTESPCSKCDPA